MSKFISELREQFLEHSESEFAKWQTAYMKDQFVFFGVRKPRLLAIVKEIPFSEACVEELYRQKEREFHYAAIAIAKRHKASPRLFPLFEKMVRTHSWWDTVDEIATHLIGSLAKRSPEIIPTLDGWLRDEDLWIRRTALIYQLRWKKETDEKRLFAGCLELAHEKDFFIRKAIGWALREYAKTAPHPVQKFLDFHSSSLSSLSLKEASKHL